MNVNISVRLELADDLPPVFIDKTAFRQVLTNLCFNARDAMPFGGTLTISTKRICHRTALSKNCELPPGHYVRCRVSDTGQGMSAEVKQRIFEPFFTTKEIGKGTGLGMSMVHGTINQLGGEIDVMSEPHKGTHIDLILPAYDRSAQTN